MLLAHAKLISEVYGKGWPQQPQEQLELRGNFEPLLLHDPYSWLYAALEIEPQSDSEHPKSSIHLLLAMELKSRRWDRLREGLTHLIIAYPSATPFLKPSLIVALKQGTKTYIQAFGLQDQLQDAYQAWVLRLAGQVSCMHACTPRLNRHGFFR